MIKFLLKKAAPAAFFVVVFLCSIDTNIVTSILFFYIPIAFLIWKNFLYNKIKTGEVSNLANIAQVVIAFCAILPLLPYTYNSKTEGFYTLGEDDKIKVFIRATFNSANNNMVLDPLFSTRISLLALTRQTFYVNEISSSILESRAVLKSSLGTTIPELQLNQNTNVVTISLISAKIFRQLIEEGFKKRWYLSVLSKIPGTKIVITIDDTYGQRHIIRPTKNAMKAIYRETSIATPQDMTELNLEAKK